MTGFIEHILGASVAGKDTDFHEIPDIIPLTAGQGFSQQKRMAVKESKGPAGLHSCLGKHLGDRSSAVGKRLYRHIHCMKHRDEQVCQRHLLGALEGVQVPVLEAKGISTRNLNRVVLGAVRCVRMG